jgi:hypothetical protein
LCALNVQRQAVALISMGDSSDRNGSAFSFLLSPQAIQRGQGKIRAYYSGAAIKGAAQSGWLTRAHNLLSSAMYILYTRAVL